MFFKALKAGERKSLAGAKPGLHSFCFSQRDNVTLRFTPPLQTAPLYLKACLYTPQKLLQGNADFTQNPLQ